MIVDVHNHPLTDDRRKFTSAVAQMALDPDDLGWCIVRSYNPGKLETTAILRRRPVGELLHVKHWPRNMFRSSTGIERGIRAALDPETILLDATRARIFLASIHNDVYRLGAIEAELLVELALLPARSDIRTAV
jgi:hypothetical protein